MQERTASGAVVRGGLVIVPNRHQILVEEIRVVHGVVLAEQDGEVTIRGGLVLAAGDHDGSQTIIAGATVLFGKYSGVDVPLPSLSTKPLRLIRYDDVYAVVLPGSDK